MMVMDQMREAQIAQRREVVEKLKSILIHSLNLELKPAEIEEDEALWGIGLGLDSIDALQFITSIEAEFGYSLEDEELWTYRSINRIADRLLERMNTA
jgi:acyl carrier protein